MLKPFRQTSPLVLTIFVITIVSILATKIVLAVTLPASLEMLVSPAVILIEAITGLQFVQIQDIGYVLAEKNIIIDNGCSGINLFLTLLGISVFTLIPKYKKRAALLFLIIIVTAYTNTIIVNAARLVVSIVIHELLSSIGFGFASYRLHLMLGILFFSSYSIAYYLLTHKLLNTWLDREVTTFKADQLNSGGI